MQFCEEREQMLERAAVREELCGREWLRSEKPKNYRFETSREVSVVDLFCGCGGLTFGVLEALYCNGMAARIKLAIDNNPHALEVYKTNFRLSDDIVRKADIGQILPANLGDYAHSCEKDLIQSIGKVDILVAGPPCQGNSNLNNWTRGDDPRNLLYLKVVRFVELAKPRIIIIENVATIINDKSQVVDKSKFILENLDYTVVELFVKASKVGIPQIRKRHILLAVKRLSFSPDALTKLFESSSEPPLSDFIDDLLDECKNKHGIFYTPSQMSTDNIKRVNYLFDKDLYDLPDSERPNCHKNKKHKYRAVYGRLHPDKPAPTITGGFGSMGQGRFVHPSRRTVITAHEAARIQGFPDFFDFTSVPTRSALYEMIGNAVPPKISALIIDFIVQHGAFQED